jgi:hypothetical protein
LTKRSFYKVSKEFVIILIILYINLFIILVYGPKKKQILLQNIKDSLKKSYKRFLKFLGKKQKSDEYLKRLGVNAWKFIPESKFLLLNIVRINDEIVSFDNENNGETDEIKNVHNDEIIKISFNAKSDVMIQTNYPLSNINNIPFDTIALNMRKYY